MADLYETLGVARDANANISVNNFIGTTANVELVAGNNTLRLDTTGRTTIPGNVIPNANSVYSLGSPTARWKDLYVTTASIYIGDEALSVNEDGNILFGNDQLVTSQQVTGGLGLVVSNALYRDWETDRKSTRLNSSHLKLSRMPSSA